MKHILLGSIGLCIGIFLLFLPIRILQYILYYGNIAPAERIFTIDFMCAGTFILVMLGVMSWFIGILIEDWWKNNKNSLKRTCIRFLEKKE